MPASLAAYPRSSTIHEVFEWYATRFPDSPAIVEADAFLSYGDVNDVAGRLAALLMARGVGSGDLVATLSGRSPETLIAWLAILKAGAAYLPLDPAYPPAVLAMMAEDAKPKLVLRDAAVGELPGLPCPQIEIDRALEEADALEPRLTGLAVGATAPAYVMFTSGSTGKPKGVVVTHRGVVRLVRDQNYMAFSASDVFLQASSLAFDACTWEIWGAWLNGARLGILRGQRLSIPELVAAVAELKVTALWLTSALFNVVAETAPEAFQGLRELIVGGDVVSPEHVGRIMSRYPDLNVVNGYGPTEATTFSLCYRMPRNIDLRATIPIGRPIAHSDAYILDSQLRPVADGEVGDLWVAGDGVALGYLDRPDLTAEKFRRDPFASDPDWNMYATGDLARRRADGLIEFLGRRDRQIKLDGKRVELDEIEQVAGAIDGVASAVASVRSTGPLEKEVVLFAKSADAGATSDFERRVRQLLADRLPAHMVPARVIGVRDFPLTINGKIDRSRLMTDLEVAIRQGR